MSVPLTLRQKIAQLLNVGFRGATPAECEIALRDVRQHGVGGIILFDQEMTEATRGRRNIVSPAQVKELVAHLQAHAVVPLLVSIDQEGGRVNRLKPAYGFPETVSHEELGRAGEDAAYRQGEAIATTLASVGINLNLAPVVDLDANPDNPIIKGKGRSFAADPEAVGRLASAYVRGHHARGVLTCAKHFPGHGSAAGDTHLGLVDVTQTWREQELIPFQRLIQAGLCDSIMSAHVFNAKLDPERPATLSRAVITGILREKLGFQGVVTSDDMEMKAISSHYGLEKAVPAAIEAGIDVLCFGNNMSYDSDIAPRAIEILARAVESGRIPESRIDQSVARVLALKARLPGRP
ncbi:glycoside hydrolase family 3 protein [Opitutus sp. ER46]|uniref:glycoside hydrolase family 3 protein n=1 Tax=Opitutus sp. ER46 TaxID=2161864 RepID=UPI000D2FACD9|nr:glycoside hydrolase family 3 protein [Opitutus sp. ER46]PTX90999.1 glycoside hydrolase family 3 [Opitutus sp. ER46]